MSCHWLFSNNLNTSVLTLTPICLELCIHLCVLKCSTCDGIARNSSSRAKFSKKNFYYKKLSKLKMETVIFSILSSFNLTFACKNGLWCPLLTWLRKDKYYKKHFDFNLLKKLRFMSLGNRNPWYWTFFNIWGEGIGLFKILLIRGDWRFLKKLGGGWAGARMKNSWEGLTIVHV